jgi:hypothetical protein
VISFRYHIVSIVSVFLALATGVALGGGPLKGEVDNTLVEQVESDRRAKTAMQQEIAALRSTNEFTDTFARTVAPGLVNATLQGRVVSLMVLPGASQNAVAGVSQFIGQAGGSIGGTVLVGEGLVDVGNKQLVDELASQLLDGTPDVTVPEDASGYERMGALVARAIGTADDGGAAVDETSNSILSGLSTAGLMSADGELERRGSLVVVVAGSGDVGTEAQQGANTIITSLASAVDAGTDGVVVAGPTAAARPEGLLDSIRTDVTAARDLSTVDSLVRTAAQVVVVQALAQQARGESGHYGALDAPDGAMPGAIPADEG